MRATVGRRVRRGSIESERRQVELGQQLALEKQTCAAQGLAWRAHVEETFNISREWADELIRIGIGVTSVEESRATKRKSQRLSRQRHNKNEAAKRKLLHYVALSTKASLSAKSRVGRNNFAEEDALHIRDAISNMISSWQDLFDMLKQ